MKDAAPFIVMLAIFSATMLIASPPVRADILSFVAANQAADDARGGRDEVRALRADVAALSAKLDKLNVCRQGRP